MLDTDPGLVSSIEQGRASGIQQVTEHLFNLARTTDKIEPIKYFLGLQDKEYRTDKAGIEVNNTILALPTMAEIRAIMAADPAMDHTLMIEGEVCENPRTGDDASGAAEGEMEE